MKKNKTNTLLFTTTLTLLSFIFFSCSKDRIETEKTTMNQYNPVNTYLDTKKQQEQVFIIDSTGNGPIVGNQGTKIWTAKQCLQFPNGDSVTWPFEIRLVELYTPKDMIYYQMPTVAAGNILETAGEIRLRAFKNGTELEIKPGGCGVQIEMPNAAPQYNHMHVYYGVNTSTYVDWTDNPASIGVTIFDTTANGYQALVKKLGWINCGYQVGNNAGSTLSFTSTTDDLQNVGIFVYFPATKSLMQVYNMSSGLVPANSNVKIVGIGIDASNQLFDFKYNNQLINTNTTYPVTLTPTTDPNLTTYLDGL